MSRAFPLRNAFTLVELSIVLVILGLLVGGVLAGQSLIRAAELRKVMNDVDKTRIAVHAYKDKYFALPGDHDIASSFFGATCETRLAGIAGGSFAPESNPKCNGNASGKIDMNVHGSPREASKFYVHLEFAGMIEPTYFDTTNRMGGLRGDKSNQLWLMDGQAWEANFYFSDMSLPSRMTIFYIGTTSAYGGSGFDLPSVHPQDAYVIDRKVDDGLPTSGQVWAGDAGSTCISGNSYLLTSTTIACDMMFFLN